MQRIDDRKRREIIKVAAKLFASRPFHQVRLEDVASQAGIGKGTIYIYFETKEDLYCSLLDEGLADLIQQVKRTTAEGPAPVWSSLEKIIEALVAFAAQHPELFDLMRAGWLPTNDRLEEQRLELVRLLERAIRKGVRSGELADAHPELTAQFLLSCVRAAMLYRPPRTSTETLVSHILAVIGDGIRKTP